MKKWMALLLALCMALSLAACGGILCGPLEKHRASAHLFQSNRSFFDLLCLIVQKMTNREHVKFLEFLQNFKIFALKRGAV